MPKNDLKNIKIGGWICYKEHKIHKKILRTRELITFEKLKISQKYFYTYDSVKIAVYV